VRASQIGFHANVNYFDRQVKAPLKLLTAVNSDESFLICVKSWLKFVISFDYIVLSYRFPAIVSFSYFTILFLFIIITLWSIAFPF